MHLFLRVHLGNPEHPGFRAAQGLPVESVYLEPPGQEETPGLRFVEPISVPTQLLLNLDDFTWSDMDTNCCFSSAFKWLFSTFFRVSLEQKGLLGRTVS